MRDSEIVQRLKRIDGLQAKISDIITEIQLSEHPHAAEIADELYQQCWFPASAEHVAYEYLDKTRWTLRVYENGGHGGIISRQLARKRKVNTLA
jgi:hypothetical protein